MSKVKMAILGCGGMSGEHARRYKSNPDVEIVALCDVSEEVVNGYIERNLSETTPRPLVFTDAAAMYEQVTPDAVTIVTPHTLHFEHGMQALAACCHVFMEKPMVTDANQAHQLAEQAVKAGKIVVIGYNTPCNPNFAFLREMIRSRELGRLETVTAWQSQDWKRLTTGTWRQKPELSGGGQMYDSGAHVFNSLVWLLETPVREVLAFTDNLGTPVDINGTANIRFEDGTLAVVTIAGNCPNDGAGMTLTFEEGRVEINPWSGSDLKIVRRGGQLETPDVTGESSTPNDNFISAVLGRAEPMTSPLNGILQSQLMDAIYQSASTGQIARPERAA
jgi:predicted dehydrogenase